MSIAEIAVVTPILLGLLAGTSSLGNGLSRMVQASSLCRSTYKLVSEGFDLSRECNRELLAQHSGVLGLEAGGVNAKAAIILTKVTRVGPRLCALGVENWASNPDSCSNLGHYVIASRVVIGNPTRWQSATGSPVSRLSPRGELSDESIATVRGNRTTGSSGKAGLVMLGEDESAYVAEVFVDAADLRIPLLPAIDTIKVRSVS